MRAAVLGRPVGHSLSPVLHTAAYAALGLPDWSYTAVDCGEQLVLPRMPREQHAQAAADAALRVLDLGAPRREQLVEHRP